MYIRANKFCVFVSSSDLENNHFSGNIPKQFEFIPQLRYLFLFLCIILPFFFLSLKLYNFILNLVLFFDYSGSTETSFNRVLMGALTPLYHRQTIMSATALGFLKFLSATPLRLSITSTGRRSE